MLVLVFDLSDRTSFESLPQWLNKYKEVTTGPAVRGVVIGAKADKVGMRQVEPSEAEVFAEQNDMRYFETSSKDSHGIEAPFEVLAESYVNHFNEAVRGFEEAAV